MAWDPDSELPIKLGPCSNGEDRPLPLGPVELEAIRRTRDEAETIARRLGMDRRTFLRSLGGAALMLGTLAACHDDANKARGQAVGRHVSRSRRTRPPMPTRPRPRSPATR